MSHIASILRYPIKGFAGELCESITLEVGQTIPEDRRFALEYTDRVAPDRSRWRPKKYFLQSATTDVLQHIKVDWQADLVSFSVGEATLTLPRPLALDQTLSDWIRTRWPELPPMELTSLLQGLTDEPTPYVSIINRATVEAIGQVTHTDPDPARFRGNLIIDDLSEFAETSWVGHTLHIGSAALEVIEPIVRCPATECTWNGHRDSDFLTRLQNAFDTACCGVFARVIQSGVIRRNDVLSIT